MSIKWKLFGYLAMFTAFLITLLWLFQTVFLDDFYKYIKTGQILSIEAVITKSINEGNIQSIVAEEARNGEVCILVLRNGVQIASADVLPSCRLHRLSPYGLSLLHQWAVDNGGTYLERFSNAPRRFSISGETFFIERLPSQAEQTENVVYVSVTENPDGAVFTVILNSAINPVGATVSTIRTQLLYISVVLVLFSLLLAFVISRQIARPLMRTNEKARELAIGNYAVEFETKGYREITELNDTLGHAAYELSRVENLRREFISSVSHDLRTPLTMISGFAEAMRDLPEENNPENAQVIIDEAERLTRLVSDLLDLSKLQNGALGELRPVNLTAALRVIVERFSKLASREDVEIVLSVEREVTISADEIQLEQVIYNLLSNAVTYNGCELPVYIRQTVENETVTVEIEDHGPGIPKEDLPYIWDRYYTVAGAHKRARAGTGLGLSITKAALDRFGARYGVNSKQNEGTIFFFSVRVISGS